MSEAVVVSHWHHSFPGLALVPSEFYDAVAQAVAARQIPQVTVSQVSIAEGGLGSAQRLYLRVRRGEYAFDICGAPFADGAFVSWWLTEQAGCAKGCLMAIPVLGWALIALLYKETYYKIDTRLMFQSAVHAAVLEVVDNLMAAKGLRALSEAERKPTMEKLLK